MTSSNGGLQGGCNAYLINIVFRDLLFVSNTSYGSKIDEMKKFPYKLFIWILKILKPDRAQHLDICGR